MISFCPHSIFGTIAPFFTLLGVNVELTIAMFLQQNRPLNSQNAADALQKFSLKKTAVQKALDALAESAQISFKEYGKQKIYLARQDQFDIPNGEELEQMKKANSKLQEEIAEQKKITSEVESGKFLLMPTTMLFVVFLYAVYNY
jgi:hypothetical protein